MSHYIQKLRIQNFKSIIATEIALSRFTPFVGQNNTGKSNILDALQWFAKPYALDRGDFHDPGADIVVEGDIVGLTRELLEEHLTAPHRERITPYVQNDRMTFRRRMPAGETKVTKVELQFKNLETNEFQDPPTGIPQALQKMFPDPVRIEAMQDASADAATNKSTSTLGRLIKEVAEPFVASQGTRIQEALNGLKDVLGASRETRAEELNAFDAAATSAVQRFFPGLGLKLYFPEPTVPDLFKGGTLDITECGREGQRFEEMGHGAQRSIQMSLIHLLAEQSLGEGARNRCTLLLIDEPELYLHPQAVEQVRRSLGTLAGEGYQVAFSTHQPFMIGRAEMAETNIVTKPSAALGTQVNQRAKEAAMDALAGDRVKQAKMLFELSNAKELWFSETLILVEGHTEAEVFPHLYEAMNGRSLAADRIGVVQMRSCGDIPKALEILGHMGLKAKAVADLDYTCIGAASGGLVERDHPHRLAIQAWFDANREEQWLTLSSEGWPTKQSEGGSEGAFARMAADPANHEHITALHEVLKGQRVWTWKTGAVEAILGLTDKNDPEVLGEFVRSLTESDLPVGLDSAQVSGLWAWLLEN